MVAKVEPVSSYQEVRNQKKSRAFDLAIDAGMLSRFQNSPDNVLGMVFGFGARANFDFSVGPRLHLIPHIGYFFERQGDASASFTTHSLLVGAQALWLLNEKARTRFRLGVESSFVSSLNTVSIQGQNSTNPLAFDAHIGPKLQIGTRLENRNELQFNITPSYSLSNSFFLLLTVGLKLTP